MSYKTYISLDHYYTNIDININNEIVVVIKYILIYIMKLGYLYTTTWKIMFHDSLCGNEKKSTLFYSRLY